eukprot:12985736-Heterocapsa_arctica.AAC.1
MRTKSRGRLETKRKYNSSKKYRAACPFPPAGAGRLLGCLAPPVKESCSWCRVFPVLNSQTSKLPLARSRCRLAVPVSVQPAWCILLPAALLPRPDSCTA